MTPLKDPDSNGLRGDPAESKVVAAPRGRPSVSAYTYEMIGHVQQTITRYLELSGKPAKSLEAKVATPCIDDHQIPPEEFEIKGHLSPIAARVVLKALYVARIARFDVMWALNALAREVTRWSAACDRRLHRLICYLHQTVNFFHFF